MPDALDSAIQGHIDALCAEISVAHHLDTEIQRELRGHIEDKVLAYLNGDEPVTAEDALVLARAHFGDPATVKGLLQQVHSVEAHDTLARRLAAAMAAGTMLTLAGMYGSWPVAKVYAWLHIPILGRMLINLAGGALLLWLCLVWWQRRLRNGKPPWFVRWDALRVLTFVAFLLLLQWALEFRTGYQSMVSLSEQRPAMPAVGLAAVYAVLAFCVISYLNYGLVWLWWCDRPPRLWQNLVVTVFAWFLFAGALKAGAPFAFQLLYSPEIARMLGINQVQHGQQVLYSFVYSLAYCGAGALGALLVYGVACPFLRRLQGETGDGPSLPGGAFLPRARL